eukprot:gene6822-4902_t
MRNSFVSLQYNISITVVASVIFCVCLFVSSILFARLFFLCVKAIPSLVRVFLTIFFYLFFRSFRSVFAFGHRTLIQKEEGGGSSAKPPGYLGLLVHPTPYHLLSRFPTAPIFKIIFMIVCYLLLFVCLFLERVAAEEAELSTLPSDIKSRTTRKRESKIGYPYIFLIVLLVMGIKMDQRAEVQQTFVSNVIALFDQMQLVSQGGNGDPAPTLTPSGGGSNTLVDPIHLPGKHHHVQQPPPHLSLPAYPGGGAQPQPSAPSMRYSASTDSVLSSGGQPPATALCFPQVEALTGGPPPPPSYAASTPVSSTPCQASASIPMTSSLPLPTTSTSVFYWNQGNGELYVLQTAPQQQQQQVSLSVPFPSGQGGVECAVPPSAATNLTTLHAQPLQVQSIPTLVFTPAPSGGPFHVPLQQPSAQLAGAATVLSYAHINYPIMNVHPLPPPDPKDRVPVPGIPGASPSFAPPPFLPSPAALVSTTRPGAPAVCTKDNAQQRIGTALLDPPPQQQQPPGAAVHAVVNPQHFFIAQKKSTTTTPSYVSQPPPPSAAGTSSFGSFPVASPVTSLWAGGLPSYLHGRGSVSSFRFQQIVLHYMPQLYEAVISQVPDVVSASGALQQQHHRKKKDSTSRWITFASTALQLRFFRYVWDDYQLYPSLASFITPVDKRCSKIDVPAHVTAAADAHIGQLLWFKYLRWDYLLPTCLRLLGECIEERSTRYGVLAFVRRGAETEAALPLPSMASNPFGSSVESFGSSWSNSGGRGQKACDEAIEPDTVLLRDLLPPAGLPRTATPARPPGSSGLLPHQTVFVAHVAPSAFLRTERKERDKVLGGEGEGGDPNLAVDLTQAKLKLYQIVKEICAGLVLEAPLLEAVSQVQMRTLVQSVLAHIFTHDVRDGPPQRVPEEGEEQQSLERATSFPLFATESAAKGGLEERSDTEEQNDRGGGVPQRFRPPLIQTPHGSYREFSAYGYTCDTLLDALLRDSVSERMVLRVKHLHRLWGWWSQHAAGGPEEQAPLPHGGSGFNFNLHSPATSKQTKHSTHSPL